MFVVTLKWNKKLALIIIIAVAVLLCALVLAIGNSDKEDSPEPTATVKSNDDRVQFLQSLGWEVNPEPVGQKDIVIPREFSKVYEAYNKLQKSQGYDLSEYCGLQAKVYTYSITNYTGYVGDVVAEIYVINNKIIGGDIHSLALDGFMHGLKIK